MAIEDQSPEKTKFLKNLETDEFGKKFFIGKSPGRKMILLGIVESKEDDVGLMLERAVEDEMKRRHHETYQNPDDKAGTA